MTTHTQRQRQAPRDATAVKVSLCAPSLPELERAMRLMKIRAGFFVSFASPRPGKYGAWVVSGTLFVPGGSQ